MFLTSDTWYNHQQRCRDNDAELAILDSQGISNAVQPMITRHPDWEFFIGARFPGVYDDFCTASPRDLDCRRALLLWDSTGVSTTSTWPGRWAASEPNEVGHSCGRIRTPDMAWWDWLCDSNVGIGGKSITGLCHKVMEDLVSLSLAVSPRAAGISHAVASVSFTVQVSTYSAGTVVALAFPAELVVNVSRAAVRLEVGEAHSPSGEACAAGVAVANVPAGCVGASEVPPAVLASNFTAEYGLEAPGNVLFVTRGAGATEVLPFQFFDFVVHGVETSCTGGGIGAMSAFLLNGSSGAVLAHATLLPATRINGISGSTTLVQVAEAGSSAEYTLTLSDAPTAPVVVNATALDPGEVAVSPPSVQFEPATWLDPRTFTITGVDDTIVDGDVLSAVRQVVASADPNYDGVPDRCFPFLVVNTTNDDTRGVLATPSAIAVPEGNGTASFAVYLATEPELAVTVTVNHTAPLVPPAGAQAVTFTSSNWSVPATVTVTSVDDSFLDGDLAYEVRLDVSSVDPDYSAVSSGTPVTVTQVDDEVPVTVSSLSPDAGDTPGGYEVTILGTGFDQGPVAARRVYVGGAGAVSCTDPAWDSDTRIRCKVAPGSGVGHGVVVAVFDGAISSSVLPLFSYAPPEVSGVAPQRGDSRGGFNVTVTGKNFGPPSTVSRAVSVGGTACAPATFLSHSTALCVLPEGAGALRQVVATVSSRDSSIAGPAVAYTYASPTVSAVHPSVGPTLGSTITIFGTGFGVAGSLRSVSLSGTSATGVAHVSHTAVRCVAPRGVGTTSAVSVTVELAASTPSPGPEDVVYAYEPPLVTAAFPSTLLPKAGPLVTVHGRNFGFGEALVPASVAIGGTQCDAPDWQSDTRVVCLQPIGVGVDREVTVSVSGQGPNATVTVDYFAPNVTAVHPREGPAEGGYDVTLHGTNFGGADFNPTSRLGSYACASTRWVSDESVVCVSAAGHPTLYPGHAAAVEVGGQDSVVVVPGEPESSFEYYAHWLALSPPADVAIEGRVVSIAGNGFNISAGALYRCRFNLTAQSASLLASNPNASAEALPGSGPFHLVSAYVPASSPSLLECRQPSWPLPRDITDVSLQQSGAVTTGPRAAIENVPHTGIPSPAQFTFDHGWTSVSPSSGVAGMPVVVTIHGGAFNASQSAYLCRFQLGVQVFTTAPSPAVSRSMILCTLPPDTFDNGGLSQVTLYEPGGLATIPFYGDASAAQDQDTFDLLQGPPFRPPAPALAGLGPFDAQLSWPAATRELSHGAVVTSYRLVLDDAPNFSGAFLSRTVANLFPETTYRIQLQYANRFGYGSASPEVVFTTLRSVPLLRSLDPEHGPQIGGTTVTIHGSQFGRSASDLRSVTIAGVPCAVVSWNVTSIACTTPGAPSAGFADVEVVTDVGSSRDAPATTAVTVANNILVYQYIAAPTPSTAQPPRIPRYSGMTVTVSGSFFGQSAAELEELSLAGVPCVTHTWVGPETALCVAGRGPRGSAPMHARTARGGPSLSAGTFEYTIPEVTSVFPERVDISGGTVLTVYGRFLGITYGDVTSVSLAFPESSGGAGGDRPCDISAMSWTVSEDGLHDALTCVVPASRYLGDVEVSVATTSGGLGNDTGIVTYTRDGFTALPPLTTAAVPPVSLLDGGSLVHVYGEGLGTSPADLQEVRLRGVSCDLGGSGSGSGAVPASAGSSPGWVSSKHVVCVSRDTTATGAGVVTVATSSAGRGTGAAPFAYTADPPVITGMRPGTSDVAGGTLVTLRGKRFGKRAAALDSITIAGVPCADASWLSEDLVVCVTPPLNAIPPGTPLDFVVHANGRPSDPYGALSFGTPCVPECGWNGECVDGGCVCGNHWTIPPECDVSILEVRYLNGNATSETDALGYAADGGARDAVGVVVTPLEAPESDLRVRFSVSDAKEAAADLVGSEIVFTRADYDEGRTVVVTGVADRVRDGSAPFNINVGPVFSADPRFDGIEIDPRQFFNLDSAPFVSEVAPSVMRPVAGIPLTVVGNNFDPIVSVAVDGITVPSNDTWVVLRLANNTLLELALGEGTWRELDPGEEIVDVAGVFGSPGGNVPVGKKTRGRTPARGARTATRSVPAAGDPSTAGHRRSHQRKPQVSAGRDDAFARRQSPSSRGASRWYPFPVPDPFDGEVLHAIVVAPQSTDGYKPVRVRNVDAQTGTLQQRLFYTSDCMKPGFFGKGDDCQPCPTGAHCPGGYRLWPLRGYWAPAEDQGFVYPCEPTVACVGGSNFAALCSPQYQDDFCGTCADGYHRDPAGLCSPCPEMVLISMLILGDIIVWAGLALSGCLLHSYENLAHVLGMIMALQSLAATGKMIGERSPQLVRDLYSVFRITSAEFQFVKPECVEADTDTFLLEFLIQFVYNICMGVLLVGAIPLASRIAQWWHHRHGPEMVQRARLFFRSRLRRMGVIWLLVIYYSSTRNALRSFSCFSVGGRNVLLTDPAQECFKSGHIILLLLSSLLLCTVTIGFPAFYTRHSLKNQDMMYLDPEFQEAWNALYEPFKDKYWLSYFVEFASLTLVALCDAIVSNPLIRFVCLGSLFFMTLAYIVIFRPYHRTWEGAVMAAVAAVNGLTVYYNFLSSRDSSADGATIEIVAYALFAGVIAVTLTVTSVVVYFIFIVWRRKRKVYGEDKFISDAIAMSFEQSHALAGLYLMGADDAPDGMEAEWSYYESDEDLEDLENFDRGAVTGNGNCDGGGDEGHDIGGSGDGEVGGSGGNAVAGDALHLSPWGLISNFGRGAESQAADVGGGNQDAGVEGSSSTAAAVAVTAAGVAVVASGSRKRRKKTPMAPPTAADEPEDPLDAAIRALHSARQCGDLHGMDRNRDGVARTRSGNVAVDHETGVFARSARGPHDGFVDGEDIDYDDDDGSGDSGSSIQGSNKKTKKNDKSGSQTNPWTAASFVRPARSMSRRNRYGGIEIASEDNDGPLLGGGEDDSLDGVGNSGDNVDEGYGVFYETSAVEAMLLAWEESRRMATLKTCPELDAGSLSSRVININDPHSPVPERVGDINRDLLSRRIERATFALISGLNYAMCVKAFDPDMVHGDVEITQRKLLQRYVLPRHQVAAGGNRSVAEILDAIVYGVVSDVKAVVTERLKDGNYAIVSDLSCNIIEFPTKKVLVISVLA